MEGQARRGAPKVRVDYLWAVQGLAGSDIQERSVALQLPGQDFKIRVMHPLMCLESKIVNLGAFPKKRDEDGVAQAAVSIKIAKAYIQHLVDAGRERDALNATERVFRVAQMDAASFAWHLFGLDLMTAIPQEGLPAAFFDTRMGQMIDRICTVRDAFRRRLPAEISPESTQKMRFN